MLQEDIFHSGDYSPSSAGEYRVRGHLVDRASYNKYAQLEWWAVDNDAPAYEAAIQAHKRALAIAKTGSHIPPGQVAKIAATIAGRKTEDSVAPSPAAHLGVSKALHLQLLPLTHAVAIMESEGHIAAHEPLQAQLLISAQYKANCQKIEGYTKDIATRRKPIDWDFIEQLERSSSLTKHLELSSSHVINLMRREVVRNVAQGQSSEKLDYDLWHFPAGTPAQQVHKWLDTAANFTLEQPAVVGTVRVGTNLTSRSNIAERLSINECGDFEWQELPKDDFRGKNALSAYHWAQDHCTLVGDLRVEGFRQLTANIASRIDVPTMGGAQEAIEKAQEEVTRLFTCFREVVYPVLNRDTGSVEGDIYEMSVHSLTKAGIQNHAQQPLLDHPTAPVVYLADNNELAIVSTVIDPEARLALNAEPRVQLRIGEPSNAVSRLSASALKSDVNMMAIAAGLTGYELRRVKDLSDCEQQEHTYEIELHTSKQKGDWSESDIYVESYEANEVQKLFREKGICPTSIVSMNGAGEWAISWRSETPDENRELFEDGIETYYEATLITVNGMMATPENAQVFARDAGVKFLNPYVSNIYSNKPTFG